MNQVEAWTSRPKEVVSLLNPAYIAVLLHQFSAGYESTSHLGAPYATPFIAAPLLIYENCKALIPKTSRTNLYSWIHENQELLLDFAERAQRMSPFVREALSFGCANGVLKIEQGALRAKSLRKSAVVLVPSVAAAMSRAQTLGKMFGRVNDAKAILATFGVRP